MIDQPGYIRPTYQKQITQIMKLHALRRSMPEQHQYIYRRFR